MPELHAYPFPTHTLATPYIYMSSYKSFLFLLIFFILENGGNLWKSELIYWTPEILWNKWCEKLVFFSIINKSEKLHWMEFSNRPVWKQIHNQEFCRKGSNQKHFLNPIPLTKTQLLTHFLAKSVFFFCFSFFVPEWWGCTPWLSPDVCKIKVTIQHYEKKKKKKNHRNNSVHFYF